MVPIMRTYFEREEGKKILDEVENEDNLRRPWLSLDDLSLI